MSIWLTKRFPVGTVFVADQERVNHLMVEGRMTYDVLMVCKNVGDTVDKDVFIWLNDEKTAALFPGFAPCEAPSKDGIMELCGESSVYRRHFP